MSRVGGFRVDMIEELEFLGKFTTNFFYWGGVRGGRVGSGGGGGRVGGGGGQGGCERSIEVLVKIQKKKIFVGGGGRGGGGGGSGGLVGGGQCGCERRFKFL